MSIKIRVATIEDIPWLIGELKKFAEFFGTKISLLDEETAPEGLTSLIQKHYFTIAVKEGVGPIGFISGLLMPHPFNPHIIQMTEVFWWVTEAHRLSRAGLMLFEEFVEFGKANADWVNFSLETASPVKDEFLTKRGFRPHERSFILEVS